MLCPSARMEKTVINVIRVACLSMLIAALQAGAVDLPEDFPGDVPVADFMEPTSFVQVRDDLMADFQAPGQTMDGVAEWLIDNLTAAGWDHTDDSSAGRNRILVFMKGDRRCGVMITDFVMSPSMQMDETIKGVQLQISGGSDAGDDDASATTAIAGENE